MASLQLHAVMVTADEVADLADSVRALGHHVTVEPPSWEWPGGARGRDRVVAWYAPRLRVSEAAQAIRLTQDWGRRRWTDRWRPRELGHIDAGAKWWPIPFAVEEKS